MSFEPQFPGFAVPQQPSDQNHPPQAPTARQLNYARIIAQRCGVSLPQSATVDRTRLSVWIDAHKSQTTDTRWANIPSSRQVAFAERIARIKRRDIPQECFRDKTMMSKWIDGNKPR